MGPKYTCVLDTCLLPKKGYIEAHTLYEIERRETSQPISTLVEGTTFVVKQGLGQESE